jgi:sporulation protein YlmC with PRC-barrel domain
VLRISAPQVIPGYQEKSMTDIPVRADVECADGPCGNSVGIIVNPVSQKVTYLVVQDQSFLDPEPRLVPIDQVIESSSDLVRLGCTKKELNAMEPFVERQFLTDVEQDPGYYYATSVYMEPYATPMAPLYAYEEIEQVPAGQLALRRGTRVDATDGHVGTVSELVVAPDAERITHLVLTEGHLWGKKEVTVPLSAVDRVEDDTVYLKLDREAVEQLPAVPLKRHHRKGRAET